jgi:DNA modification methylase
VWLDINYLRWNHPERYGFYDKKTKEGGHPTQKPEELFLRMILLSSNKGDTVLDPFVGSGTSAVVCLKHDRKFIGFEIDQKWEPMIKKRMDGTNNMKLEQFAGFKGKNLHHFIEEGGKDHEL